MELSAWQASAKHVLRNECPETLARFTMMLY